MVMDGFKERIVAVSVISLVIMLCLRRFAVR